MANPTEHIRKNDRFAAGIGAELVEAGGGKAVTRLRIEPRHLNSKGMVHGGVIFTLADLAFPAAENPRGNPAVAANAGIAFVNAVRDGRLIAEAVKSGFHPKLTT